MRGFDRQLRVWLTGNVAGPLLLWWFDTDLTLHMAGELHERVGLRFGLCRRVLVMQS